MVNIFKGRRKSSGNAMEDLERENEKLPTPPEPAAAPAADSGGFKVLSQSDVAAKKELALKKQQEKEKPRFGRFSGFGSSNNKSRQQSLDEDSPSSSKRDSKSSSGTQFSSNRPYHVGQFGSTSTLPSSADTDSNDNIFSGVPPRPYMSQHNSSPSSLSMGGVKKALPQIPPSKSPDPHTRYYAGNETSDTGRSRAMTSSSYASTAIPPKLDADLSFGGTFDDLFSGLDKRRHSPEFVSAPGRSLLDGGKRNQPEPIRTDRKLDVEAPLPSWESRGSADNLMSPNEDDDSPPPPVPPHKYGEYAPVLSHSPDLGGSSQFQDNDAKYTRDSVMSRRSTHEHSPESKSATANSAPLHTPLSTRSAPNNNTPRAAMTSVPLSPDSMSGEDDNNNMFAPSNTTQSSVRKALPVLKENVPPPPSIPGEPNRKVLTAAEFQAQKERQMQQPHDNSSDEEDYEDEEEEIRKREEEQINLRKKQQQMQMAREALKRSTTAPGDPNRPSSFAGNGFPSEVSLAADDWSDEDVPLGVLAHHVGPKRNDMFAQLPNATPSYFQNTPPTIDRPASAGALGNRASSYKPVFARNLPDDPYAGPQFIGGGLVRHANRESMGFNNFNGNTNRAQSVYGEPTGYQEPTPQFPTLVGQIQMRESTKQKYMGGASSKQLPQEGPFTGALGAQMNGMNQPATRMSQMPMQNMMGMNPMMMNNGMGMLGMGQNMGQGMGQGMGQMYPQAQNPQMEQLQQMIMMQQSMLAQMQTQQFGMNGQAMPQDPRMSMLPNHIPGFPNPSMNGSMPNLGSTLQNQRPISVVNGMAAPPFQQQQQQRPFSTFGAAGLQAPGFQHQQGQMHLGPPAGYTASIAPSERSNIGMSSRYRPVTTGNGLSGDHLSTVSSQTLQASGGAPAPGKIKGILKNRGSTSTPAPTPMENEEEDWSKLRSRKNKFGAAKEASATGTGATTSTSAFDDIDARVVF